MIVAISISPSGGDETGGVSEAVAEAVRVIRASGLPTETNAMFTNIEGEWDEVMAVVKQAVDVVAASSPRVGLVLKADIRPGYDLFVPHATAGIAILETGAGSDDDLLAALDDLLPADDRWRHRHGSPGHGRSHVMPALVPPYATVPVLGGRLALGTWQSICLVDLNVDNPDRSVRLSFLPG
jgi:secondary thiamine-phosphate synthase enzyme